MKLKTLVYDCSKKDALEFISGMRSGKNIKITKNSFDTHINWFSCYSDDTKELIATWTESDKKMGIISIAKKFAPRKYHDAIDEGY